MRGEKHAVDLATQRSLATLSVNFYVTIEELGKARLPKTSKNFIWEESREIELTRW